MFLGRAALRHLGTRLRKNGTAGNLVGVSRRPSPLASSSTVGNVRPNNHDDPTTLHRQLRPFSSFSSLPQDEEEAEKKRVASLTDYERTIELREIDKEIARLQTLRGINTGELYTFRGRFKALARDYGVGFMVWYWAVWCSTGALTYVAIDVGGVDAMVILAKMDGWTGWDLSTKVDPTLGTIGLTLALNECLEPVRLPIVVLTTKPVVNAFYDR